MAKKGKFAYAAIAGAVLSLIALFLVPTLLPNRTFADTPTVTPSITIGNSGTLAFSVNPGQFATGTQNITVTTSNYTGYSSLKICVLLINSTITCEQ